MEKSMNCFCMKHEKNPVRTQEVLLIINEYYLIDIMQFILPFMKVKLHSSNLKDTEDKDDQNSNDIITDIDLDNNEVSLHNEIPSTSKENFQKRHQMCQDKCSAPNTAKKRASHNMNTSTDVVDKSFVDYITSKKDSQTNKINNSDLNFFKSSLPS